MNNGYYTYCVVMKYLHSTASEEYIHNNWSMLHDTDKEKWNNLTHSLVAQIGEQIAAQVKSDLFSFGGAK